MFYIKGRRQQRPRSEPDIPRPSGKPFRHLIVENPKDGMRQYQLRYRNSMDTLILAIFNARDSEHAREIALGLIETSQYRDAKNKMFLCDGATLSVI